MTGLKVAPRLPAAAPKSTAATSGALPAWYPRSWNLEKAAQGAAEILKAQGKPPSSQPAKRIVFSDADLTLLKTTVGFNLADPQGKLVLNPATGKPILLEIGGGKGGDNLEALKKKYPSLPWDTYSKAHAGYDDPDVVQRHQGIPETMKFLRASERHKGDEQYVITARWDERIPGAIDERLKKEKVNLEGVFVALNDEQSKRLGFTPEMTTPQRKALTMAAMLKLRDPESALIRKVTFMEDNDPNMRAAMDLLPKLFPKVRFEFVDVVHQGGGRFVRHPIAHSEGNGPALVDKKGRPFTQQQVEGYTSPDKPWDPR